MTAGVVLFARPDADNHVDDIVEQARTAYGAGIPHVWFAQQFDVDAIALSAVVGAAVPGLGVGTSVVPINPRHPLVVAGLAQTAQAASHGNFRLGLGLGAHGPEQHALGISPVNTVTRLRGHLTVLRSVFHDGAVDFVGEQVTARPEWPVRVAGSAPVPTYVAAMGPKALAVTGELADGTLPYLAGPRTIGEFIVPTITKAAADAGRPAPQVIAFVPVLVTDDLDAGRQAAVRELEFYENIRSYRNVLAREGVDRAGELALVGTVESVAAQATRYLDAGATDIVLSPLLRTDAAAARDVWQAATSL